MEGTKRGMGFSRFDIGRRQEMKTDEQCQWEFEGLKAAAREGCRPFRTFASQASQWKLRLGIESHN